LKIIKNNYAPSNYLNRALYSKDILFEHGDVESRNCGGIIYEGKRKI
jgi:hypothetical protein